MSDIYLVIVILLFVLAISDLVVGVSNDAVNFLNSSIGSRVASRKTIMVVASLGIFVGATFSSGMMEVARKGIFNPEFFYFGEIMIIFLAVMITDIILLDFFNTIGLPTSTTVSIVFELLGAAVMISLIKVLSQSEGLTALGNYINSSQAVLIISGIFLSVIFAFTAGVIVQYISRLIFTFQYKKGKHFATALWSGLAMTAMTFFLLFKGLKGASFITDNLLGWLDAHMMILLGCAFGLWTASLWLLKLRGINVFRIVVLFGTFALAMAFAGNDLVNFIGVPIAGFESYLAWSKSGTAPMAYTMEILQQPVRTKSYLLLIAGLIMILTLWFSKKARSVTDTEVNLGRQEDGHERFTPNRFSRSIVRSALGFNNMAVKLIPPSALKKAEQSFHPASDKTNDKAAFDLVRAGVNLTMASVLIAVATSMKLPLSTTYVSFMVAMGTSLADRAWGRDSAVFRVAGVLNVIGGWFATAFIAFTVAAIFALAIHFFELTAIIVLISIAIFFIGRSFIYHRKKDKKKQLRLAFESDQSQIETRQLLDRFASRMKAVIDEVSVIYGQVLSGLIDVDRSMLQEARQSIKQLVERNEDLEYELYRSMQRIKEVDSEGSRAILYVYDLEQDMLQSVQLLVDTSGTYIRNMLSPLKTAQVGHLKELEQGVLDYLDGITEYITGHSQDKSQLVQKKQCLLQLLETLLAKQVSGIKSGVLSARNSQLIFKVLLETKDMVAIAARFIKLYDRAESGSYFYTVDDNN